MRFAAAALLLCAYLQAQSQPVHMAASTSGFTDASGTIWTPNICSGATPYLNSGTYPNPIYSTTVSGNPISCIFTVAPGLYSILVHTIESVRNFNAPQKRVFSIFANGNPLITGLDVYQRAGGVEIPYDVIGVAIGPVTITFSSTKSTAIFAGIELIPITGILPPEPSQPAYLYTNGVGGTSWSDIVVGGNGTLFSVSGTLDTVLGSVPLVKGFNPWTGGNDFSVASFLKLPRGAGVPVECDGVTVACTNAPPCAQLTDVATVFVRSDAQAPNSSVYVCTQAGLVLFEWELLQ